MALGLQHQTLAEFGARLRERYRNASKDEAARIAHKIIVYINRGDITDTQVRNAFGLTQTQYNTLKAKLIALNDHWLAMQEASGE